jgi:hypothetical protein
MLSACFSRIDQIESSIEEIKEYVILYSPPFFHDNEKYHGPSTFLIEDTSSKYLVLKVVHIEEEPGVDYIEVVNNKSQLPKGRKIVSILSKKWFQVKGQIPDMKVVSKNTNYNSRDHAKEMGDIHFTDPFARNSSSSSSAHKRQKPPKESSEESKQSFTTINDTGPKSYLNCKSPSEIMKALHTWKGWAHTQITLSKNQLSYSKLATRLKWGFLGYIDH